MLFLSCLILGSIQGELMNGTTGGPGQAESVVLILLESSMEPIQTLTNVDGTFEFELDPSLDGKPLMVQAIKAGVRYSQSIRPGMEKISLTVYDAAEDVGLEATLSTIAVYCWGETLELGFFYAFDNNSQFAFVPNGPTYVFPKPKGATEIDLSTRFGQSPDLRQSPAISESEIALHYPLKPGRTTATLKTVHPYSASEGYDFDITVPPNTPGTHIVVVPLTLELQGPGVNFSNKDEKENIQLFEWENDGSNQLSFKVSGAPDSSQRIAQSPAPDLEPPQRMPDPLSNHALEISGGLLVLMLVLAGLGPLTQMVLKKE